MEERLEQSSLETILIDSDELFWIKKGKEVLVKGKLFDVKSISFSKDKIQLWGLFDTTEDEISKKILELENDMADPFSPMFSILAKLLSPAILNQTYLSSSVAILSSNKEFPAMLCGKQLKPLMAVFTPPPIVKFTA
ncbi:MAG: hypothetical protein ABIS01_05740 [Ferruginibacter sp.]